MLSKDEIIDLALRYIAPEEVSEFPLDGDLFCLLNREAVTDRIQKEEEGWAFAGYAVCKGYSYDDEAKPRGKWLWMHFISLTAFPPVAQVLKLQPPHVVKGRFQNADRTIEIKIVKLVLTKNESLTDDKKSAGAGTRKTAQSGSDKIIAFRPKSTT